MQLEQPISKWEQQGSFHSPGSEGAGPSCPGESSLPSPDHSIFITSSGTAPSDFPNGDLPQLSFDVSLKGDVDHRNKDSKTMSNPTPAKPGA